ncbi:putative Ulp1 protease family catalytic domain-containing protein [Rosa chinensis]|uniref:Putative Ulp1 protease family catalytic domain-containing protein n=1 Tax=Rosa chinensis TaxID=74649 RepID=A0A2P6QTC2_ROSCH|nr:putative Ulp1 protease family catalytic domain-containing protein [Rosa chinensis]
MVEMVELWMTAVKEQADDMLGQGCRMKFDEKNSSEETLKMMEVPLTETERESIKWIKDNYKRKMAVTEIKDNPQQGEDSLDCGLFVMYTMEKISQKGTVPKKLTKDDILNFRAQVVKSFAESRHSWNSKHNEV